MALTGVRSSFPNSVDTFQEMYDLPASEFANAQRYQVLKAQPVLTGAEQSELNQLVERLSDYIISPEVWNKWGDAVINTQTFFLEEVDGYIKMKQDEWAQYIRDFHFVGVHDANTAYRFQNMVKYNGDLYLALQNVPAGTAITNTNYWVQLSQKGDKGDVGLGLIYKGEFSPTATYNLGDAVTVSSVIYYCKQDGTTGINPPSSGDHWVLWDKVVVSETRPEFPAYGMVWVELLD